MYRKKNGVTCGNGHALAAVGLDHRGSCRQCRRDSTAAFHAKNPGYQRARGRRRVLGRYGLSERQFNELRKAQKGLCAICEQPPRLRKGKRSLHVDHDHQTQKVRGLLCHECNMALGKFGDSIALLHRALAYLERHE